MATNAKSSKGVKLQRGDGGGSEVFTTIGEVTNFKGPSEKAPQLDATSFDSTAMEFIAGLGDSGEVTFDILFVGSDAQQQGLRTDLRAGTLRNFKLNLNDHVSDPTIVSFSAIVTAAPDIAASVNAVVKGSCTLKVSGQPIWHYRPS
jgi:hypothetical protein